MGRALTEMEKLSTVILIEVSNSNKIYYRIIMNEIELVMYQICG
jgi:hypothetical protein